MSKLTFKQFLDEQEKKASKKRDMDDVDDLIARALGEPPKKREVKPIPLKKQVKPIATTDEKKEPTAAELALRAAVKQKQYGHFRTLADVLGIYPA